MVFGIASCKPVIIEGQLPFAPIVKPEIFARDSAIVMKYGRLALNLYLPRHTDALRTTRVLVTCDSSKGVIVDFSDFSIYYLLCNDTLKPFQNITQKLTIKPYGSERFEFQYPSSSCPDTIKNYFITGTVEFKFAESRK